MREAKCAYQLVDIEVPAQRRPVRDFDLVRARRVGQQIAGILDQGKLHLEQETNHSIIEAVESILWYFAYCGVDEVEFDGQVKFLNEYFTISALTYPDTVGTTGIVLQ